MLVTKNQYEKIATYFSVVWNIISMYATKKYYQK